MKDLDYIITLIMLCRQHPSLFRKLCRILGSFYKTVGLDGLPCDQVTNRTNHRTFSRHDAAWLHEEIDREITVENRTTRGFLVFLVENKRLWEAMTLLE